MRRAAFFHPVTRVATVAIALLSAAMPVAAQRVTWSTGPALPLSNSEFDAAEIDGKVYAAGGFVARNSSSLLIFDPATQLWSTGPPIPRGVHHAGVAAVGGKLYVIDGGDFASARTQVFDPVTNLWSSAADLPTPRTAPAVAVVGW